MIELAHSHRKYLALGLPLTMFIVLAFMIVYMLPVLGSEELGMALTLDLLIVVPFLYFLLIRKTTIPLTTVVPVMLIGVLIGNYLLPEGERTYLNLFKTWALPFIEISVLVLIVMKVRQTLHQFKKVSAISPDFYDGVKATCLELFPTKLAPFVAAEISVIYYGIIHWRHKKLAPEEFSYHKNSGTHALMGALLMAIVVETVAIHFLISEWNNTIAWILTGLSLYSVVQIGGIAKSLSRRPVVVGNEKLVLRYGIMNQAEISYDKITSIFLSKARIDVDSNVITLSPLGQIEQYNVIIDLAEDCCLYGLYGSTKHFRTIALYIDELNRFQDQLSDKISVTWR